MIRQVKITALIVLLLGLSLFTMPSHAQNQEEYQLHCSISFTPISPHQTETFAVLVTIENLGDVPFNGKIELNVNTDKQHSYETSEFQINNLVRGDIQNNSASYRADDDGIWWAKIVVQEENFANMKLYVGSNL